MTPETTSPRGAAAPQPDRRPPVRRPALPVIAAGLAALVLVTALAGIAAATGGDSSRAAASPPASPAASPPASAAASATPSPSASASPSATPVWQRRSYRKVGFDKTFKADLIDELPAPPDLVVFGGSRAMRFAPSSISARTGLSAFNCAVQCFRPEDAWAFSSYLYRRSPETRLRCVIALQARTLSDDRMRAGLLYDDRLSVAFPGDLVAAQKAALGKPAKKEVLGANRYTSRGYLVHNRYDVSRDAGYRFANHIDVSIARLLPNHAWHGPVRDVRARSYFEKTMRLYNDHGVTPLVILMPVQPRALAAFRAAGFQRHLNRLTAYLEAAQRRCAFRVLDFTDIRTFRGSAVQFYDAVHSTRENARRIVKRAVELAPECFE